MTRDRQPGPHHASASASRWLALVCLLLFGCVSTAQAAHIHLSGRLKASTTVQGPSTDANTIAGEDHCPLCVVAQPALPISLDVFPLPTVPETLVQPRDAAESAAAPWHPCSLSRPPPAIG